MAICPFASWEPLSRTSPAMTPSCVVVHSNAGTSGDLHGWWESNPDGLMSHFQIGIDGQLWQYVDTEHQAYANVEANAYGISIESANNPEHTAQPGFDSDRWQGAQLASLVRLLQWIGLAHPQIPMAWCTDGVHGIGAHDEFAQWTTPGHQCPGAARTAQLRDEIIPSLSRPAPLPTEDDDMPSVSLQPGQAAGIVIPAAYKRPRLRVSMNSAAKTHGAKARIVIFGPDSKPRPSSSHAPKDAWHVWIPNGCRVLDQLADGDLSVDIALDKAAGGALAVLVEDS